MENNTQIKIDEAIIKIRSRIQHVGVDFMDKYGWDEVDKILKNLISEVK
jgi:hypothetical protein